MKDPNVDKIDVYEESLECTQIFHKQFRDRDGYDKVNFIVGDVRQKLIGKSYDTVYMDIYKDMLPDECFEDMALFMDNNTIGCYRFWGQEKVILWMGEHGIMDGDSAQELRSNGWLTWADDALMMQWIDSDESSMQMTGGCDYEYSEQMFEFMMETEQRFTLENEEDG